MHPSVTRGGTRRRVARRAWFPCQSSTPAQTKLDAAPLSSEYLGMVQTVWHYTDFSSALSIVKNGEFWAHSASEMVVDSQEITYGLERIRYYALEECPNYVDTKVRELLEQALTTISPTQRQSDAYIFAATQNPDSAQHWKQFGARGIGLEIVTEPRVLTVRSDRWLSDLTGWYPVAYTESDQRTLVHALVGALAQNIGWSIEHPGHPIWSKFSDLSHDQIRGALSPLSHAFKRLSLSGESEYRYLDCLETGSEPCERYDGTRLRHFTRVRPPTGRLPIVQVQFSRDLDSADRTEFADALQQGCYSSVAISVATNG